MRVLADTHIHLYPCYDAGAALRGLRENLGALDPAAVALGCFAERHDCGAFEALRDGRLEAAGCRVEPVGGGTALQVGFAGGGNPLYLVPGRQVVTGERLEVLALATERRFEDGTAARDLLPAIRDAGGVPVLAWAPGKWLGARGRVVDELLAGTRPGELLVGDTTLRPGGFPQPRGMRRALAAGIGLAAGSDPLPIAGEERWMGTYASVWDGAFEPGRVLESARERLRDGPGATQRAGRRGNPFRVFLRFLRNERVRRGGGAAR